MQIIIHPGHPKCGSTSIQRALLRNRHKLAKKNTYFPDNNFVFSFEKDCNLSADTPRLYFKNIHLCQNESSLEERLIEFEKRLIEIKGFEEKYNCKKIIVSAENLVNRLGGAYGRKVHELFAKHFNDIKIVYFIRLQEDFILSAWQQWSHKDGTTIEDFVKQSIRQSVPNYLNVSRFFASCYGQDKVKVVPLHPDALTNGNLIEEFMLQAGVDAKELNTKNVVFNETLNPYLCEVLSEMNGVYSSIHDPLVKKTLLKFTGNAKALSDKAPQFLSLSLREKIRNHFDKSNKILHREFLEEYRFESIFQPKDVSETGQNDRENQYKEIIKALISPALINKE
ncbi:hypothetical protein [Aliikangiella sp. G2MR2-5]|uniref:hypothetical protein n=1 Tax=Aliikangiella sp. G2MR2-5 TaxID=2788943 RepID=UPI0018AA40FE|nr:hypothetical protein [Aliikangiella sp. G2MR2-5]